jgi:hypothetical protein
MKKFPKLIILLLTAYLPSHAQFGISGNFGFGSYSMQSLKNLNIANKDLTNGDSQLQLYQLENFPMFRNFSFAVFFETQSSFRISVGYKYLTTGSRLYNADYSGRVSNDITTSANIADITFSWAIIKKTLFNIGLFMSPEVLFCNTNFIYNMQIYPDANQAYNSIGKAINAGISGGVFIRKRINKIEFSFETGYYFDILKGKLKTEYGGNKYEMFNPKTLSTINNDWSGFRFAFGTAYFF